jgi:hypothetical protein
MLDVGVEVKLNPEKIDPLHGEDQRRRFLEPFGIIIGIRYPDAPRLYEIAWSKGSGLSYHWDEDSLITVGKTDKATRQDNLKTRVFLDISDYITGRWTALPQKEK